MTDSRGGLPGEAPPQQDTLLDKLEAAHRMVVDLSRGRRDWTMSIPARPDHDPDLIIGAALREAMEYVRAARGASPAGEPQLSKAISMLQDIVDRPEDGDADLTEILGLLVRAKSEKATAGHVQIDPYNEQLQDAVLDAVGEWNENLLTNGELVQQVVEATFDAVRAASPPSVGAPGGPEPPCPACRGSASVDGYMCPDCRGSGVSVGAPGGTAREPEWWAVYLDGKPCAAYPNRTLADVYASGFSRSVEIRELRAVSPPGGTPAREEKAQ